MYDIKFQNRLVAWRPLLIPFAIHLGTCSIRMLTKAGFIQESQVAEPLDIMLAKLAYN